MATSNAALYTDQRAKPKLPGSNKFGNTTKLAHGSIIAKPTGAFAAQAKQRRAPMATSINTKSKLAQASS